MRLSDKQYDFLKWLAIYFMPGLTTFIGVVGIALNWQYTAIATTIIGAFGGFIATCIGMSVSEYERAKREEYEGKPSDMGGD
jgi:hypothetical protein